MQQARQSAAGVQCPEHAGGCRKRLQGISKGGLAKKGVLDRSGALSCGWRYYDGRMVCSKACAERALPLPAGVPKATPAKKAKPLAKAARLTLPTMGEYSDWCLRACTSSSCQLPRTINASQAFPPGVTNAFFSRPCPDDSSSAWLSVPHASGYVRWVNVATNQCLTLRVGTAYTYAGEAI